MKLENKKITITGANNNKGEVSYFELISQILNSTPIQGVTTGIMREVFKFLDKLDTAKEDLEINESELNLIISYLTDFKWGFQDREFIIFEDYINDLSKK